LILDEPSLGLAPLIVKDIFDIIKQLKEEGLSVLIVEQNALQTLKIADYGYVLQVGEIVKSGPAKDLVHDPELIEAYLGK
jgi:branched-chain amino acid transport system ATP-binding protein